MSASLNFLFGQDTASHGCNAYGLDLNLPNNVVAGARADQLSLPPGTPTQQDIFSLWQSEDNLCGVATVPVTDTSIEAQTAAVYLALLNATQGYHLHRLWHFVPYITRTCGEVDRYMLFCSGRAQALCDSAQKMALSELPPATAVGTTGDYMALAFIAGRTPVCPVENPLQVPAYRYPERYGPRAPSFARAGTLADTLFVSGTASIRNSESLHANDPNAQFATAMENIQVVTRASEFDLQSAQQRHARVYLKTPEVWNPQFLDHPLMRQVDHISAIQADICRPELQIEVELYAR